MPPLHLIFLYPIPLWYLSFRDGILAMSMILADFVYLNVVNLSYSDTQLSSWQPPIAPEFVKDVLVLSWLFFSIFHHMLQKIISSA
jgi:hypothetical protein